MDVSGSVNTMKKIGEKIIKQYGITPDNLELVYHDMGSYSAKPKAHGTTLDYNQWLDYNQYNKGFSGAPLVIPAKKYGGSLNKYQKGTEVHQKVYTDPEEFAIANRAYNDSLDAYNNARSFNRRFLPNDNPDQIGRAHV